MNTPNDATLEQLAHLSEGREEMAFVRPTVPELFFATKKRHDHERVRCTKCLINFLPDVACPNCGSRELEPFDGKAKPIKSNGADAEATLNAIDPEWRERFHGDSGAALDYYMRLL